MTSNNQANPASAIPVYLAGANYQAMSTNEALQIKAAPGVFYGLDVQTGGTTSNAAVYDGLSSVVTITLASPGIISWPSHGLVAGSAVVFETTGALPTGLIAGTTYYVANDSNLTAGAFAVSDTKAHALAGTNQINTSGSQSGVQTGFNVSNLIGSFATTGTGEDASAIPTVGVQTTLGLIVITTGGAAATLLVFYQ
jgi:hypothetical protein